MTTPRPSDPPDDGSEFPPVTVTERPAERCEWCGRPVEDPEALDLAADLGRKIHGYLPRQYHACGPEHRAATLGFLRRHLRFGPLVWTPTFLSFAAGLGLVAAVLPPPFRLIRLGPEGLLGLLALIGLFALAAGSLLAALPFTFVARRPQGDPPVVPLARARLINRALGFTMAGFALVMLVRAAAGT